MIKRLYRISCDDCGFIEETDLWFGDIYQALRRGGWAVTRDRKFCFCPKCAKKNRSVGRNGNKILQPKRKILAERRARLDREYPDTLYI